MTPELRGTPKAAPEAGVLPVRLPAFEGLELLGEGAGSSIYRVRRTAADDKTEYVLKLLERPAGASSDDAGLTALRREAALLTSVNHPHLPRVHEVGVADRRPYLVLDLVRGTSLAALLDRGQLSAQRLAELVLDVIEPLAAVHARGLVHGDLKPHDVMVRPDRRAQLIDLGLTARQAADRAEPTVGTLAYAAPEQAGVLKRPVDHRCDLYSLGVIMFEALAGTLPFATLDVGELLRTLASVPAPDLTALVPDVPPELAHVVATLLAKDPDDRYPDGWALAADLRAFTGGQHGDTRREVPPMFGRQAELEQLKQCWAQVRAGSGALALMRSEPGRGRTRLAQEFGDLVEEAGGTVLRARLRPGDPMPFAPFRNAFAAHLRRLAGMPWGERWEHAARLREVFDGWSPSLLDRIAPGLDAVLRKDGTSSPASVGYGLPTAALAQSVTELVEQRDEEQAGTAISTALLELAKMSGGLLLILDDVTAADSRAGQVIGQLAAGLSEVPLLVLGTGWDTEAEHPPGDSDLDPDLRLERLDLDLRLERLDEASVGAQIRSLVPGRHLPDEAVAALVVRSNGNPFVAEEYLWAVLNAGLLWPSWDTWQLDLGRLDALNLPTDAMGLVLNRVRSLDAHSRDLLMTGAAMGAGIRADVVASVRRTSTAEVMAVYTQATRQRLMEVTDEGTFQFRHDRIAQALLAEADPAELEALHHRIAGVLAAAPAPSTALAIAHTFAIAQHYVQAGSAAPADKVLAACVEAGKLALQESAAEEAVAFLEHAAKLGAQHPGGNSPVLVLLGRALKQTGQFDAARRRLEEALAAEPDPLAQSAIYTQLAEVHRSTYRSDEMGAAIRKGFAAAGRPLPTNTFWLLLSSLMMALVAIPRRRLRPLLGDASGVKRRRALTMAGLHEAALSGAEMGLRVPELIAHNLRSLYWAAQLGHGPRFVEAQANVGALCAAVGLKRAAERCFRRCDADPSAHSQQVRAMLRSLRLGGAWAGNRPEGRAWRRQFGSFSAWLDFTSLIEAVTVFSLSACFAGRTQDARHWLGQGRLGLAGRTGEVTAFVAAGPMTAALLGRPVEAEQEMSRLTRVADEAGARQLHFIRLMAGLFVLLEDGRTDAAVDRTIDELEAMRLSPVLLRRAHRPVLHLIAAARLAQARAADSQERERRLGQAQRAVQRLGKAAGTPEMTAFGVIARADLLVLQEQPGKAVDVLKDLDLAGPDDLPTVAFEAARIGARAFWTLNPAESRRRARTALMIATAEGWPQRAAVVATEFALPDPAGPAHQSVGS